MNPNNGNEKNQALSHGIYPNLTSFFTGHKIIKISMVFIIGIFQFFSKQEYDKTKSNGIFANLTAFFLIYKVLYFLNDFCNLFLEK